MTAQRLLLFGVCAALFACGKSDVATTQTTGASVPISSTWSAAPRTLSRDYAGAATPADQGKEPGDLETSAEIRNALAEDPSLSPDGKSVRVVTSEGVVTLRGYVPTAAEKQRVKAIAAAGAGRNRVEDQVDVEPHN
jgi:osmotically-inducible protein OsmY